MDPVDRSAVTPNKKRLARTFAKVLQVRAGTAADKTEKSKSGEKLNKPITENGQSMVFSEEDEKLRKRVALDAFVAKVFATVSSVKAAYAQLQHAQSPYDAQGIQSADQTLVCELKNLSESKQSFLKKHIHDSSPETTRLLAEFQEQKNTLKMYEMTSKKMENQIKLKESETVSLKAKLDELNRESKLIERRLKSSGCLSLHFSTLTPSGFVSALQQTTDSIRCLVKFMISEMESANWNLDAAAGAIQPGAVYWHTTHKCYAFESFVCGHMFDGFNHPNFSQYTPNDEKSKRVSFDGFTELKSLKASAYITWKPTSMFAKFCWSKYLKLVHPKMELSLFGNLNQRNLASSGIFPDTTFFSLYAEAAKRVWLLHCLAFSFDGNGARIFQAAKGTRFTEVFMQSVNDEAFVSSENLPEVAFTVVPGFMIGKTVVQCQVYLS